jgi:hypothetical protein
VDKRRAQACRLHSVLNVPKLRELVKANLDHNPVNRRPKFKVSKWVPGAHLGSEFARCDTAHVIVSTFARGAALDQKPNVRPRVLDNDHVAQLGVLKDVNAVGALIVIREFYRRDKHVGNLGVIEGGDFHGAVVMVAGFALRIDRGSASMAGSISMGTKLIARSVAVGRGTTRSTSVMKVRTDSAV